MSNPMDHLEVVRDLIRKEEAEFLHQALYDLAKEVEKDVAESVDQDSDVDDTERLRQFLRGLEEAMLIVDGRIGHLRDRWG